MTEFLGSGAFNALMLFSLIVVILTLALVISGVVLKGRSALFWYAFSLLVVAAAVFLSSPAGRLLGL